MLMSQRGKKVVVVVMVKAVKGGENYELCRIYALRHDCSAFEALVFNSARSALKRRQDSQVRQ